VLESQTEYLSGRNLHNWPFETAATLRGIFELKCNSSESVRWNPQPNLRMRLNVPVLFN
jgi:hypothetical protein